MIKMRFKLVFFDIGRVVDAVDPVKRRALMRAGAFIRTAARSSIRRAKKISAPGKPPHSHAGHLKRLLFFSYSRTDDTVIIGPARFRKGEAPNLLERGGTVMRRGESGRIRRMVYRPRPFMGPAMKKGLDDFWAKTSDPAMRAFVGPWRAKAR